MTCDSPRIPKDKLRKSEDGAPSLREEAKQQRLEASSPPKVRLLTTLSVKWMWSNVSDGLRAGRQADSCIRIGSTYKVSRSGQQNVSVQQLAC